MKQISCALSVLELTFLVAIVTSSQRSWSGLKTDNISTQFPLWIRTRATSARNFFLGSFDEEGGDQLNEKKDTMVISLSSDSPPSKRSPIRKEIYDCDFEEEGSSDNSLSAEKREDTRPTKVNEPVTKAGLERNGIQRENEFNHLPRRIRREVEYERNSTRYYDPASSVGTFLSISLRKLMTPERFLRVTYVAAAYWLTKTAYQAMKEVVDEMLDEQTKEDHDTPLFSADVITESVCRSVEEKSLATRSNATHSAKEYVKSKGKSKNDKHVYRSLPRHKPLSPKHRHVLEMIVKLHAAGFPLESPHRTENLLGVSKSAEAVLRSLTKNEGQVLSSCLLVPETDSLVDSFGDQKNAWDSIGGLGHVKEALLDTIYPLLTSNNDNILLGTRKYYGGLLSHPTGVLVFGPPGCGKTMLARALASTVGARFLSVSPSSLLRKFVGETNLNVRALFSLAKKIQPCIIFVDEMDGLFRERQSSGGHGHDEHDVSRDLKTEFMQLWDGVVNNRDHCISDKVLVIGATNRPFDVDAAFLRRMPRSYFVGLPDYASRLSILEVMLSDVPLSPDFDFRRIAKEMEGYSPSDMKEVLRNAALIPLREARLKAMRSLNDGHSGDVLDLRDGLQLRKGSLRSLATADVLHARQRIAATQYSSAYRAALAEYASRSGVATLSTHHVDRAADNYGDTPESGRFGGSVFDPQLFGDFSGNSDYLSDAENSDDDDVSSDFDEDS